MNRLRELRIEKGWRQSDLAAALNMKPQTVSHYEKGDRDIDSETICRLCDIFGCTADYLLGRSALVTNDLSEEEVELVLAFRNGDDRSREIVRLTLAPFTAGDTAAASGK